MRGSDEDGASSTQFRAAPWLAWRVAKYLPARCWDFCDMLENRLQHCGGGYYRPHLAAMHGRGCRAMVKCAFCQYENEDGAMFCEQCKSDLGVTSTPNGTGPSFAAGPASMAVT